MGVPSLSPSKLYYWNKNKTGAEGQFSVAIAQLSLTLHRAVSGSFQLQGSLITAVWLLRMKKKTHNRDLVVMLNLSN